MDRDSISKYQSQSKHEYTMEKWANIKEELKQMKSQHAMELKNYQKTIAVLKTELAKNRTTIKNLKLKDQQQKEK